MPRFVILKHELPPQGDRATHWDLMLESGDGLTTWALDTPPQSDREVTARRLADHRPAYLDYEGSVSGGRGTVARWDAGQYALRSRTPVRWVLDVRGARLVGQLVLESTPDSSSAWTVRFVPAG